jgi:hypothetical protein
MKRNETHRQTLSSSNYIPMCTGIDIARRKKTVDISSVITKCPNVMNDIFSTHVRM